MSQTPIDVEMQILQTCVTALSRIETDPAASARVMEYLNGRFPRRVNRAAMMVPEAVTRVVGSGGVIRNVTVNPGPDAPPVPARI